MAICDDDQRSDCPQPPSALRVATGRAAREITSGHPQDALKGTVKILGDVVEPVLPPGTWELEKSTLE